MLTQTQFPPHLSLGKLSDSLNFPLGRGAGVSLRGGDARERGSRPRARPQPHAVLVQRIQEGQPTHRPAGD